MDASRAEISRGILAHRQEIAERVTARQCASRPDLWDRYGKAAREKGVQDVNYHLLYLTEALTAGQPVLFSAYLAWAKVLFTALKLPPEALATNITILGDELRNILPPPMFALVQEYLDVGLRHLSQAPSESQSFIVEDHPLGELARNYLTALVEGNRNKASKLIMDAVGRGIAIKEIYLKVFQVCQREIGHLWQTRQISIAQEHYCTAATQWIMAQLYPKIFVTPETGRRFIGACVAGELHEMGIRMVADIFEMEGWDTYYVGANTPIESILQTIKDHGGDVLGISTTMTFHINRTVELIERVRQTTLGEEIKIIVGGYPFIIAPQLYQHVGADGYATDALDALLLANRLVAHAT